MKKQLLIILLSGLLLSCSEGEKQPLANPTQIDKYFPLKDFVEDQIDGFDQSKVEKITEINGEKAVSEVSLNADDWRKELDAFIQADINKAALALSYQTVEKDGKLVHSLKPGEKGTIQEITVTYQPGTDEVSSIYFKSEKENFFYQSSSEGSLEIDESGLLKEYKVTGFQKVWFLSPNEIRVKGEVIR